MQHAPYLKALCTAYAGRVLFAGVYITEAHAADEWPVGARISFCKQPTTMAERAALAAAFQRDFALNYPLLVDTMANHFLEAFAAWPFRFYVVRGGKIVFKAELESYGYNIQSLGEWLEANVQ